MKLTTALLSIASIAIILAPNASAWDDTGHQVVAFIAYNRLSPATKEKVDRLFPPKFEDTNPGDVGFDERGIIYSAGRLYGPYSIANWMDDLRDNSYDDKLKDWHHISVKPVFADIPPKFVLPNSVNIRERIVAMLNQLIAAKGFAASNGRTDDRSAAEALGFLFHLVGDVHQPLHCATRYSNEHKNGDFGGNSFKIDHTSDNLHSFWDKGGGLFHFKTLRRPLKQEGKQQLAEFAKTVTDGWPADAHRDEWMILDPDKWVDESNTKAHEFSFKKILPGAAPSDDYIQGTQKICIERLALAGYRLAAVIEQILGTP
jgi:hypothetical protein